MPGVARHQGFAHLGVLRTLSVNPSLSVRVSECTCAGVVDQGVDESGCLVGDGGGDGGLVGFGAVEGVDLEHSVDTCSSTIRSALDSWKKTARLCVILLVMSLPAEGLMWLAHLMAHSTTPTPHTQRSGTTSEAAALPGNPAHLFKGDEE